MGTKMGEKPPGPGIPTSMKRSTDVAATMMPNAATVLAPAACP